MELLAEPVFKENEEIPDLIKDRWAFLHTESMGFAYFLDPRKLGGRKMVGDDKKVREVNEKTI